MLEALGGRVSLALLFKLKPFLSSALKFTGILEVNVHAVPVAIASQRLDHRTAYSGLYCRRQEPVNRPENSGDSFV